MVTIYKQNIGKTLNREINVFDIENEKEKEINFIYLTIINKTTLTYNLL